MTTSRVLIPPSGAARFTHPAVEELIVMVVVHPDTALRASAPPRAPRRAVTRARSSNVAQRLQTGPESSHSDELVGIVLTAAPLLVARPALRAALRAARCVVHAADTWRQLLEDVERSSVDAVLVDLDAADRDRRGHLFDMSGHRLVSLLARRSAQRPFALIVQTALDFAEIEDLLRLGVHALARPDVPDEDLGPHVRAVISRTAHARRVCGRECAGKRQLPVPDLCPTETLQWLPDMPHGDSAGAAEQPAY